MNYRTMLNKTLFKFLGGGIVIVALAVSAIYVFDYYQYRQSPEYQAQKYFEDLKRQYEQDTYGGDTPEETLQLFIDALKKGDTELASKYFVVEKQEEWIKNFSIAKENNNLHLYIDEVQRVNPGKRTSAGKYLFTVVGNDSMAKFVIVLVINPSTNKWKIEDL